MHLHQCALCHIDLDRISVRRGGQVLLQDVSMHIHCGQLTVLIGQNGAGKTTLIRALLGELPHSGTIRHVDGRGTIEQKSALLKNMETAEALKIQPLNYHTDLLASLSNVVVYYDGISVCEPVSFEIRQRKGTRRRAERPRLRRREKGRKTTAARRRRKRAEAAAFGTNGERSGAVERTFFDFFRPKRREIARRRTVLAVGGLENSESAVIIRKNAFGVDVFS